MRQANYTGRGSRCYVAAQEVADIVNLAILLERPILVEGEPGCGKRIVLLKDGSHPLA